MATRAEAKLQTRRSLGDAALKLFSENGYAETTIDDIVEAAGVSRRTFFYHFPTKVAAAFPDEDVKSDSVREVLETKPDDVDDIEHLRRTIDELFTGRFDELPRLRERYQLVAAIDELRMEDLRTDFLYEQVIADYLIRHGDGSSDSQLSARRIAAAIVGTARACFYTWADFGDAFDPIAAFRKALEDHLPSRIGLEVPDASG